ncbi:MAG: sulfite exporter TauE/SafE family protein [Herminiimonas sp.]|nr:sulfite exporter TauE/SafE family protein [Herminiimonas sp.]
MSGWQIALVAVAAFCAGAMNWVPGGGIFFSLPALPAAGVPPIAGNAGNSVASRSTGLSGAWIDKKELAHYKRYLIPMGIISFPGGIGRGLPLLPTKGTTFSKLILPLRLFATVLFAFSGGFFGAGMGMLIFAGLAMARHGDVHEINGIKNFLSDAVCSVAGLTLTIAEAMAAPLHYRGRVDADRILFYKVCFYKAL